MKKFLILILGLSLTAASCNLFSGSLGFASGDKGVFKSDDAGKSFRPANQAGNKKDALAGASVNTLVFDPRDSNIMYLGSSSGIYRTQDGAGSWKYILTGIAVSDIAIDPYRSDVVYAAGISGNNGKVIKTVDGGTSWIDIYTEPTSGNAVSSLAINQYNPLIIVASLATGEIIRSTDEGNTWQASTDLKDRVLRLRTGLGGSMYALAQKTGVYRSLDEGKTWTALTGSITSTGFTDFSSAVSSVSQFFDMALDQRQQGVLYLGTEQGLVRTVNDGANWSFMNMPLKNTLLRVSAVGTNPSNSNNIYAVVGSTMFKSLNGGVTWETRELPTGQETRTILVDPQSTNIIYLGLGNKK